MKAKLLVWLLGSLLLGSVAPAQANSCGSDCVNQCSGASGGEEQVYKDCLDSCVAGCLEDEPDVPDVPEPTPVEPDESTEPDA